MIFYIFVIFSKGENHKCVITLSPSVPTEDLDNYIKSLKFTFIGKMHNFVLKHLGTFQHYVTLKRSKSGGNSQVKHSVLFQDHGTV